jgi:hypothetical protein
VTRQDLFRKRIAPILFFGLLGLIAYDFARKQKHAGLKATMVIELGEARPRVRELEADLYVRGERVSEFRRAALPGAQIGECRFEVSMPDADGELRITVDLGGEQRQLTRGVHVEDGATVRVNLAPDLRPRAAAAAP